MNIIFTKACVASFILCDVGTTVKKHCSFRGDVTTKDPFGGGTELHYDRAWANKEAGGDIRDYAQSPETLQELLDLISLKEIDPNIPKLTITTPRDEFSPFMSSMFGFELVVNAPGNPAKNLPMPALEVPFAPIKTLK